MKCIIFMRVRFRTNINTQSHMCDHNRPRGRYPRHGGMPTAKSIKRAVAAYYDAEEWLMMEAMGYAGFLLLQ